MGYLIRPSPSRASSRISVKTRIGDSRSVGLVAELLAMTMTLGQLALTKSQIRSGD